eukprot:TRINITY_DN11244_c0_g2_i1.p1 TRINITY_DN11244_c0_g2~~TRINITY_DN11244_c0_g2_i1.p1  ORF type:complete len:389 (+),score=44.59 TRINITY_DN11244_c0_g2_i1:645-1811(+)
MKRSCSIGSDEGHTNNADVKRRRVEFSPASSDCGLTDSQGTSPARELVRRMVMVGQDGVMGNIPTEYTDLLGLQTNGSFGKIIKCTRRGEQYIIKRQSLEDCSSCETAYRELRTLVHITQDAPHDSLIEITDAWQADGFLYIVEPFMDLDLGKYLLDMSVRQRSVTQASRDLVMKALLSGLSHLHGCNIMHRDLKPENVCAFTDELGRVVEAKLVDFGSCRRPLEQEHSKEFPPLTYGRYVTTHPYRAPETVADNTDYSFKVDSWSAGCILAELLTGKALFSGDEASLSSAHASWDNSKEALRQKFSEASCVEIDVLHNLLARNPENRMSPREALALYGKSGEMSRPEVPFYPPHYSFEDIQLVKKQLSLTLAAYEDRASAGSLPSSL